MAFSHASPLNVTSVARDCEVERKVVEGYVGVLEDLLLAFRLQVFTRRARRSLAAHPKLYLFDAGVYRALRARGPLDRPEEIDGGTLEGLVAQHLRAWISYGAPDHQLAWWRTRAGLEVDLVVYGPREFAAIEVENAARLHPGDLRSLRAFHEDYPEARLLLIYRGRDRLEVDGILCIPCEEFLRGLVPGRPLS